jgi:glutamate synthase (NADPH/NADH) large chain
VETGEAREVHQFCTLAGYGAEAINPYLAFDTIDDMLPKLAEEVSRDEAVKRYIKAVDKGMLKVMSKMGISTYQSYCGAQIFDAVGLRQSFVDRYFTGTSTQVEGVGLAEIATETVARHQLAFGNAPVYRNALDVGGEYAFRYSRRKPCLAPANRRGRPAARRARQHSEKYREFARQVNEQDEQLMTCAACSGCALPRRWAARLCRWTRSNRL